MVLQILILVSIVLQIVAVVVAVRLSGRTKYNVSWMLLILALVLLCVVRLNEYLTLIGGKEWRLPVHFMGWVGVVTSLCLAVGMFYVGKLINSIRRMDAQRKIVERRILSTVLRTEEQERTNFSKELHDGLGPLLSSAKMTLSELAKSPHGEGDVELIRDASYVIDEAIRGLREISNKLSPHMLNTFGLARAVSNFIDKALSINTKHNIDIKFTTNLRGDRFDSNVEVILYRVVCELIANSIKHSGANLITLALDKEGEVLHIVYADNGRGFDPSAVIDTGMGLSNITSRINSLKGTLTIESARAQGMRAEVKVNTRQSDERPTKL